jgi:RNA polymerase sigma-70 factor (ECF subfamily)
MDDTDVQLVRRMAAGNPEACAAFYDRHAPRIYGFLTRLLAHQNDADDVLQEVFWQAWKQASRYDPQRSTPLGWLLLMARSRALDLLRKPKGATPTGEVPAVSAPAASEPLPRVQLGETADQVQAALAQLPPEQRALILMSFFQGITHEQIAAQVNLPLGTVKTRIRRGIGRLRDLLQRLAEVPAT